MALKMWPVGTKFTYIKYKMNCIIDGKTDSTYTCKVLNRCSSSYRSVTWEPGDFVEFDFSDLSGYDSRFLIETNNKRNILWL